MSKPEKWHSQHSCVKYEDLVESVYYAITLNPEDSYQFWDAEGRDEMFYKHHTNYLKRLTIKDRVNVCMFVLFPEISPTGRLHFHGYVKVFKKKLFYLYVLSKLKNQYSYEIDVLTDDEVWSTYIKKQSFNNDHAFEIGNDFKKMTKDFFSAYLTEQDV